MPLSPCFHDQHSEFRLRHWYHELLLPVHPRHSLNMFRSMSNLCTHAYALDLRMRTHSWSPLTGRDGFGYFILPLKALGRMREASSKILQHVTLYFFRKCKEVCLRKANLVISQGKYSRLGSLGATGLRAPSPTAILASKGICQGSIKPYCGNCRLHLLARPSE